MKFGKLPPKEDARTLRLENYITALPTPTKVFGFGSLYTDWGVLGNDQYGDCVFASAAHQTMMWTKLRGGVDVPMSTKNTLQDYSDVTGFDPKDPSTDQGAYVLDSLKYRRSTGCRDAAGNRHKIEAYVSIDPKNFDLAMQACFVFGAIEMGFEVPETIWDQMDNGEYWDVVDPNAFIVGGHDVHWVGSRNSAARATFITWGKRQQMTRRFYETYNDETWVPLSAEQIRPDGKGIHGLNLVQLQADLAAL